jgi:hypothetical protein
LRQYAAAGGLPSLESYRPNHVNEENPSLILFR